MLSAGPGVSLTYNRVCSSNFSKYSEALQILPSLQAELEEAQQSQQELEEMATYMALLNSNRNPLAKLF